MSKWVTKEEREKRHGETMMMTTTMMTTMNALVTCVLFVVNVCQCFGSARPVTSALLLWDKQLLQFMYIDISILSK